MDNYNIQPMMEAFKKMFTINPSLLTGIGWGTIQGLNPIKLEIANGVFPPSNQIELSPFCKEWTSKRLEHLHNFDDKNDGEESSGDRTNVETRKSISAFTFWRGLQIGDKVCFIRVNDSQKYVVLWRENQFDLEV